MVILTETEQAQAIAYDRMTATQMQPVEATDINPVEFHLDAMLQSYQREISFNGAEIGALSKIRTTFRKNKLVVALCDLHIRICNDIMAEALEKINAIRAEKKPCRV
jgi:hypothetical protein